MIYGYIYVSAFKTNEARDKWLAEQTQILNAAGVKEILIDHFTPEKSVKKRQLELESLFERLQSGDRIIVSRLERFARTVGECTSYLLRLEEKQVGLEVLDPHLMISTSDQGKAIRRELIKLLEDKKETFYNFMSKRRIDMNALGGRPRKPKSTAGEEKNSAYLSNEDYDDENNTTAI